MPATTTMVSQAKLYNMDLSDEARDSDVADLNSLMPKRHSDKQEMPDALSCDFMA